MMGLVAGCGGLCRVFDDSVELECERPKEASQKSYCEEVSEAS